ncbi:MAG: hypothetical protein ACP5RM_01630 [Candidatus Micrarchaeia archaeon]
MYYSDFEKIRLTERMLEKLAYLSVAFDVMAAVATFFAVRTTIRSFSSLLMISDYLIFIEVVIAGILVAMLVTMKYYDKILRSFNIAMFKMRHHKRS